MSRTAHCESDENGALAFLWLELTNRCNLSCKHCYAESGPHAGTTDILGAKDWIFLIDEARDLGCREIQFIGGEPTLCDALPSLLHHADNREFTHIEIFSNLTRLPSAVMAAIQRTGACVATSVYGPSAEIHDKVTARPGSFERTLYNARHLLDHGIEVRAGFIEMSENEGMFTETKSILNEIGIINVGTDRVRRFGRGRGETNTACDLSELCGSCSGRTLCIGADGTVSPCIMSKEWSIGSIVNQSLTEIAFGKEIDRLRSKIYDATVASRSAREAEALCDPGKPCFPCAPQASCPPCAPNTSCPPTTCRPYCMPN